MRRSLRGSSREGQSNEKCSIRSMRSLVGHIGFIVSHYSVCWIMSSKDSSFGQQLGLKCSNRSSMSNLRFKLIPF